MRVARRNNQRPETFHQLPLQIVLAWVKQDPDGQYATMDALRDLMPDYRKVHGIASS